MNAFLVIDVSHNSKVRIMQILFTIDTGGPVATKWLQTICAIDIFV